MLTGLPRARPAALANLIGALAERRSVAAMEFAMVAPILATLTIGVFDVGRALIIWQQLNNAASAIVQAAEKISITAGTGGTATELTPQQMQDAMTTIYAQVPGLALGKGTGPFNGAFAVTLSDVVFWPICTQSKGCGAQIPYTIWSSYLTQGGVKLSQPPAVLASSLVRLCYPVALLPVKQFPDDNTQLTVMLNPILVNKGQSMTLTPQLVADVRYVYTPNFPFFVKPVTLWASATLPAPFGGLDQQVILNAPANVYNTSTNPESCPNPPG